ncbi:hypothetical protein FIBSPDRAFT_934771, partial [Athelia psychrophila]
MPIAVLQPGYAAGLTAGEMGKAVANSGCCGVHTRLRRLSPSYCYRSTVVQSDMSQNITFKIQDIKCDHLPKPADAWIKQAFSAKLLLGGREYSTDTINGSTTSSWSSEISLQASGSSPLEIEVHNRINGRNKLVGSFKDTVQNILKESSSETVVRTLRKMDRRGVMRQTTVELTFSI